MASFKFKLESLVKLRAQKEEEAKRQLANRLKQIRELEDHLAGLKNEVMAIEATIRQEAAQGAISAPVYLLYKTYQDRLNTDSRRGEQLLGLTKKEEEKDRAKLLQANIDHRLINKLKEKSALIFYEEQTKKEQDILEDLAGMAQSRQRTPQ